MRSLMSTRCLFSSKIITLAGTTEDATPVSMTQANIIYSTHVFLYDLTIPLPFCVFETCAMQPAMDEN